MIFKRSSLLFLLSIALVGADTIDKTNLRKKYEEKNTILEETESNVGNIPELSLTDPNLLELNTEHTDTYHRRTGAITVTPYTKKKSTGFGIGMQSSNNRCNILQKQTAIKKITNGGANFIKIRHAFFSERFDGLRQVEPRGVIGMSDHLEGNPTNPLTLVANFNPRENLYVEPYCENRNNDSGKCGIQIKGRGPTGFRGPGALSVMFKEDKSIIQLRFASSGASKATVLFFRRDGSYIDKLDVDIEQASKYNFYHGQGEIAGMSIFPLGDNLTWHKFSLTGLCYEEGRW